MQQQASASQPRLGRHTALQVMSRARLTTALTQPLLPALAPLLLLQAAVAAGVGQPATRLELLRTWTLRLVQQQKRLRVSLAGGAAGQGSGVEQRQLVMVQLGQQQQAGWRMAPVLQRPRPR